MATHSNYSNVQTIQLIIALCLAQFCISADIATMSIATSVLIEQFDSNVDALKIAGTIFPLVGASLMLISGVVGLYIGWRRLLICGLILGVASSLSKLYAPSIEWISLVSRSLAGLAGVAILPSTLALVVGHFPSTKRAHIFGSLAASTGLAAAIIPMVSGWMFDNLSWYSGFIATTGFYVISIICATFWIPPLHNQKPAKFDAIGSLLSACSMLMIIFGLLKTPEWGVFQNNSPYTLPMFLSFLSPAIWLFLSGISLFLLFVKYEIAFERKYQSSLIPSAWFKNRQFLLGVLILVTMYVIFGGLNFSLVAFLQIAIDLTAVQTGMIILVFAISMILFSICTPILFKRFDERNVAFSAFALCCVAVCITLYCTDAKEVSRLIYLSMIIFGAGIGMLASQSVVIITKSVGEKEAERTGGVQATLRNIGLAIGVAIIAGMGQASMENKIRTQISQHKDYSAEIRTVVDSSRMVPYVTDEQLSQYLVALSISDDERDKLLTLNAEARRKNFHSSLFLLLGFGVIGMLACRQLQKS